MDVAVRAPDTVVVRLIVVGQPVVLVLRAEDLDVIVDVAVSVGSVRDLRTAVVVGDEVLNHVRIAVILPNEDTASAVVVGDIVRVEGPHVELFASRL